MNTDEASIRNPGQASCAGIARDMNSDWIPSFWSNIGTCGSFEAELWGVVNTLKIFWSTGWKQIVIQCDSLVVLSLSKGALVVAIRVKDILTTSRPFDYL